MARFACVLATVLFPAACGTSEPAPRSALGRHEPAQGELRPSDAGAPVAAAPEPAVPADAGQADPPPSAASSVAAAVTEEPDGGTSDSPDAAIATPPPPPPLARRCSAERWNGWEGTPACRQTARRRIAARDLACSGDADCVLIGTSCDPHAVSAAAAARYERWPAPCTPPGGGSCGGPGRAVCFEGCCTANGIGGL